MDMGKLDMGKLDMGKLMTQARPRAETSELGPYAQPWHVEHPSGCFFYHTLELPGFGLQEGGWDLRERFDDYIGGVDVRGQRVLDVGTAGGFLSFEAEKCGAREVVSFDLDDAKRQDLLPFADGDYVKNYERWRNKQTDVFATWKRGYWLSHRLLKSRCKAFYGDIYDLPAEQLGSFDVVILGAVLEHLVDPLSAINSVSRLATKTIVINTDYADHPAPLAFFKGRADLPGADYIFWTYTIALYDEYMKILGFEPVAQRKSAFAGTRPAPGAPRPMLDRVALVYDRKA